MLALIFVLSLKGAGFCQEEKSNPQSLASEAQVTLSEPSVNADEPKEEILEKTMDGEVAGVSPNFIAIDYGQDTKTAYEMTFNITKDTRLERIKDTKNLKPGDTVWVKYQEKVVKYGKQVHVKERILKVLRLLNTAKVVVEPVAAAENIVTNVVEESKE